MTDLLRHALATLAYRAGKTLRGAPPEFATFVGGPGLRSPLHLVTHLADLMAWSTSIVRGAETWAESTAATWEEGVERFYHELATLDNALARAPEAHALSTRLMQGPLADALTHVGQLAMLRRMAGAPIKGENYFRAEISVGRVGTDQAAPRREFSRTPDSGTVGDTTMTQQPTALDTLGVCSLARDRSPRVAYGHA